MESAMDIFGARRALSSSESTASECQSLATSLDAFDPRCCMVQGGYVKSRRVGLDNYRRGCPRRVVTVRISLRLITTATFFGTMTSSYYGPHRRRYRSVVMST